MAKTVVGIFDSVDLAEKAARQVKDNGLRTNDISIVAKDDRNIQETERFTDAVRTDNDNNINDNISGGTVTGGVLGGLTGVILGMGTIVIPGLGVLAATGPIAGLLAGTLTGGIVGGLVDLGIPEEASRRYEQDVQSGKILWSMTTSDENVDQITNILKTSGASNVEIH